MEGGTKREHPTELRSLVMEVRIYPYDPMLRAGPAALLLSSEMDEAAHDHALLISGPIEHLLAATDFTERSKAHSCPGLQLLSKGGHSR